MLDIKHPIPRSSSPFPNDPNNADPWDSRTRDPYSADDYNAGGGRHAESEVDIASPGYSNVGERHEMERPYKVQKPIEAQHFGYQAPSEQTTYAGGGGQFF